MKTKRHVYRIPVRCPHADRHGRPCGWKGYRLAPEKYALRLPCPQCGGFVERRKST